jgi:hypothetical protein
VEIMSENQATQLAGDQYVFISMEEKVTYKSLKNGAGGMT